MNILMNKKLYDDYFDEIMNLNPSLNDSFQIEKYKHLNKHFENYISEEHIKKEKKLYEKYLAKINSLKKLSLYDSVLKYQCVKGLNFLKYDYHLLPLEQENNVISFFCEMANGTSLYVFKTIKDYENFINKTQEFLLFLDTCIENMTIGMNKNVVLPIHICKLLLKQLNLIKKEKPYLNKKIKKNLDFDFNKKMTELLDPYLDKLIKFLKNIYIKKCQKNIGRSSLKNGKKMYENLVQYYTGIKKLTIKQIHNYGLEEVERIHNEMIKVKNHLKFKQSLTKFNEYLNNKKDLKFQTKKEALDTYKNKIKEIKNTLMKSQFNEKIKTKCDILEIPDFNNEFISQAYYVPPSLGGKRNGRFYLNVNNLDSLNIMEVEALTLHEAYPGHHFQLSSPSMQKGGNGWKSFIKENPGRVSG